MRKPMPPPAPTENADASEDGRVEEIVRRGPGGAFAVAGVATAIVVASYFLFYFLAYLPRGAVQ
jgi:hypothetical protein